MAYDLNVITIIGRLTRDPEQKDINDGKSVVKISIATNPFSNDKSASFFDCSSFNEKQNENIIRYLKKGNQVAITGKLIQNKWQTQSGENRYNIYILLNNIQFLQQNNQSEQNSTPDDSPPF